MTEKPNSVCKRVLFVDDHEVLARLSVEILEMNGYGAESASTAAEAIQKADKGAFDIVVSDFKLDDMSGLELARRLPKMPFIVFSGHAPVERKGNVIASLNKEELFPALLEKLKELLAEPVAESAEPSASQIFNPHKEGIWIDDPEEGEK